MKALNKYIHLILMSLAMLVVSSCDVTNLDAKDSPNALTPGDADITFFTNSLQENFADFFSVTGQSSLNEWNMEPVRMLHMFGPLYFNAYIPQNYDNAWTTAYASILQDAVQLEELAEEKEATNHVALAKIFRGLVMVTLVDMFGEVPFEEANKGAEFLNPNLSSGQDIYNSIHSELDDAIALLEADAEGVAKPTDYYYGSFDPANWIAIANTLKMKMYLNTGDANGFNAVVTDGRYISSKAQDFQWKYSSVNLNPDSRHPQFGTNYDNGGADYMSNDYMNEFINGKSDPDPRLRYYFYRQTLTNTTDPNEKRCISFLRPGHYPPNEVFCLIPNGEGYWGRDHGDNAGIPPDNLLRTIYGFYPIGGKFDANDDTRGTLNSGAQGAGISPVFLSFYVDFMRAEAAQNGFTGEDPRALLESAIRGSMDKVLNFDAEIGYSFSDTETPFLSTATDVDDYVAEVLADYDAANSAGQLEIIMTEYWLALWGNGYEAYNAYRRTGYPSGLQPTLEPNPGDFINSHLYPATFANNNSNVNNKSAVSIPVFWQTITDLD